MIVMALNNHSTDLSNLVKNVAKFLNVKLSHLPPYSPKIDYVNFNGVT